MSIRDRIRSRNGLITAPAARSPRRRSSVKPDGGPRRPAVIVARGSAATPLPSLRHNRGTTQEGGQTVDARGIIGTAGVRAERPRRGKSVQRMHLPRIRWLFEYIRSLLLRPQPPCSPFSRVLLPSLSLPRPVRTHAIFARDLMPPELCAPYLCTERVYTRLALATGETVKAPVPTISYTGRQAPGPRALAPPCMRTSHIMESRGPTTILKGRAPDNGGKGREKERVTRRGEARTRENPNIDLFEISNSLLCSVAGRAQQFVIIRYGAVINSVRVLITKSRLLIMK